jgi:hypothetical protein
VFVESLTPSRLTKKPAAACPARAVKSCDAAFMKVICPTCQWSIVERCVRMAIDVNGWKICFLLDQAADQPPWCTLSTGETGKNY